MTFENCVDKFPIWKTIIGNYGMDETFTISSKEGIDDIEHWHNSPLEWENDSDYDCAYPFVVYVGEGKFECWYFAGQRVNGYLNETTDPEKFFPATYSDDFGWEPYDPNNRDNYNALFFIPDMGLKDELIEAGRIKTVFLLLPQFFTIPGRPYKAVLFPVFIFFTLCFCQFSPVDIPLSVTC